MESLTIQATPQKRLALRKLVWVGPLTIVIVALVNIVIRTLAVAFFGIPDRFQNLQASAVISSTAIFLLLAILVFVLVSRFARRPIQFYCILAGVALFLSFSTPIMALTGVFAVLGMDIHIFWTMVLIHFLSPLIPVA